MTPLSDLLYNALLQKGYREELCKEIAYRQLNTDYTARRMLGYLKSVKQPSVEEVVDEMLAILSDRNRFVEKHELERTNSEWNNYLNNGF